MNTSVEVSATLDDFERMKLAECAGAHAWKADLARRFDFSKQPKNPHRKDDCCNHWWWVGYTDAMVEWFAT